MPRDDHPAANTDNGERAGLRGCIRRRPGQPQNLATRLLNAERRAAVPTRIKDLKSPLNTILCLFRHFLCQSVDPSYIGCYTDY